MRVGAEDLSAIIVKLSLTCPKIVYALFSFATKLTVIRCLRAESSPIHRDDGDRLRKRK